jgi:hypothetical protein
MLSIEIFEHDLRSFSIANIEEEKTNKNQQTINVITLRLLSLFMDVI